jgi:hypothetical protein
VAGTRIKAKVIHFLRAGYDKAAAGSTSVNGVVAPAQAVALQKVAFEQLRADGADRGILVYSQFN